MKEQSNSGLTILRVERDLLCIEERRSTGKREGAGDGRRKLRGPVYCQRPQAQLRSRSVA